jgi:hypothetical protein
MDAAHGLSFQSAFWSFKRNPLEAIAELPNCRIAELKTRADASAALRLRHDKGRESLHGKTGPRVGHPAGQFLTIKIRDG